MTGGHLELAARIATARRHAVWPCSTPPAEGGRAANLSVATWSAPRALQPHRLAAACRFLEQGEESLGGAGSDCRG